MLRIRLHYAHVCARLLCQPVDAQVEIVLQTANGQKVRPIARQKGGGDDVAGSSRLKAMKVCPSSFLWAWMWAWGWDDVGGSRPGRCAGQPAIFPCLHRCNITHVF